jgi:hypothetical protein
MEDRELDPRLLGHLFQANLFLDAKRLQILPESRPLRVGSHGGGLH